MVWRSGVERRVSARTGACCRHGYSLDSWRVTGGKALFGGAVGGVVWRAADEIALLID